MNTKRERYQDENDINALYGARADLVEKVVEELGLSAFSDQAIAKLADLNREIEAEYGRQLDKIDRIMQRDGVSYEDAKWRAGQSRGMRR